ncbi:MAG: YHS domain-containing protein [Methanotrichaceae archaeon]|nr:YHS domain-containing protein [Methanotrichaceae archaeon]
MENEIECTAVMLEGELFQQAMETEDKRTLYQSEYEGKTYFFCGYSCKKRFDKNPAKFTAICWYHESLQTL